MRLQAENKAHSIYYAGLLASIYLLDKVGEVSSFNKSLNNQTVQYQHNFNQLRGSEDMREA